jgi:hypothetical protein
MQKIDKLADIHRGAEPSDPRRQRIEQPMIGWFQQ